MSSSNFFEVKMTKFDYKNIRNIVFSAILLIGALFYIEAIKTIFLNILGVITPFLVSGAVAFVLTIPMNFIEKLLNKVKSKKFKKFIRPISIILTLILTFGIITLVIALIVPQLINAVVTIEKNLPAIAQKAIDFLKSYSFTEAYGEKLDKFVNNLSWTHLFDRIKGFFDGSNSSIAKSVLGTASGIFGSIANAFFSFIFTIYILADKEHLSYQAKKLVDAIFLENAPYVKHVLSMTKNNFYYFVKAQLIKASIMGIVTFIMMMILGLPYPSMIAVIAATTDLVPLIGPIIGVFLGVLFILIESPTQALIYAILGIVLQQLEGNILDPKLVGNSLSIPPMWSLFAVVVGGSLYGVVGMWLFVPLFATLYKVISEWSNSRLKTN